MNVFQSKHEQKQKTIEKAYLGSPISRDVGM
jgi:hypothetical protein